MKTTDSKIKVTAPDLLRALTAVLPHVGEDTLPVLHCIGLMTIDGRLYVSATDRYTVGVWHLPLVDPGTSEVSFQAVIDVPGAKALMQILKLAQAQMGRGGMDMEVTLEATADKLVVEDGWKTYVLRLRKADSSTPALQWRMFVPQNWDTDPADVVVATAYSLSYLGRFAKATSLRGELLKMYQAPGYKPLFVTVGENFFGLIMPVKLKDGVNEIRGTLPPVIGGLVVTPKPPAEVTVSLVKDASDLPGVTVTPGAPPKDEDAPDLSGKKPAAIRPAASEEKTIAAAQTAYRRSRTPAKKAPVKKAPVKKAPAKKAAPRSAA